VDINDIPAVPAAPTQRAVATCAVTLEWPEPEGSVVTDYDVQYRLVGGPTWSDAPAFTYTEYLHGTLVVYAYGTLSGLTTGEAYEFRVRASNALGASAYSAASAPLVPMGSPGAPTGVAAIGEDGAALVSFTPPVNTGGVPLTGFQVVATPGGATATGGSSPITLSGLVNNTAYSLAVRAANASGYGPAGLTTVTPHAPIPPEPPELLTLRRAPNAAFEWGYQFAAAPTAPGQSCVEGQHAWDDTYLYTCVSGGRWVYVQPYKMW
jgi:hypothetical protein